MTRDDTFTVQNLTLVTLVFTIFPTHWTPPLQLLSAKQAEKQGVAMVRLQHRNPSELLLNLTVSPGVVAADPPKRGTTPTMHCESIADLGVENFDPFGC